jgi:hypothetical protein
MGAMTEPTKTSGPAGLIATLDDYLVKRAPFQIPESARELIVKFGPWISLVLLVLTLPFLLVALGLGALLSPLGGVATATSFGLAAIVTVVQTILLVMALPGLFGRKMSGWMFLFYEQLLSFVGSVLAGSLIGGGVALLIGLYVLFQVRQKYH